MFRCLGGSGAPALFAFARHAVYTEFLAPKSLTSGGRAGNVVTIGRKEAAAFGEAVSRQMADPEEAGIRVVPANEASWEDLQTVMGARGQASTCQCQWFKIRDRDWRSTPVEELAERLRGQTGCGNPGSTATSGLVAYFGDEPAGWCAVEPRTAYVRLLRMRVPRADRDEDRTDDAVWAVTCFVTRTGFRRRGVSRTLAKAAVDFARERGARAIEGYPLVPKPGQEFTWGELYVGSRSIFADAGFSEVSRPTPRRAVMRIDF